MAKIPYPTRLDPQLLDDIKEQARTRKRSVNNMIEVLLQYGMQYLAENTVEPEITINTNRIESKLVTESNALS